jgi:long-subunit acyl-CoA synthetase (AMP-forming)
VERAVVVGDGRRYLAALLTLDPERVGVAAEAAGSEARDVEAAAVCPRFRAALEREVEVVNSRLARFETIKRFAILPGGLSVEAGELTPTLKLKRRVIYRRYAETIEALYRDDPPAGEVGRTPAAV